MARLLDTGPVVVLAVIAAVGSFTHISDLAARHGQTGWQSWAVAVCIDLMCVMAARELQRDKRTGRSRKGLVSWPALVLTGGIVLTLAANLATARPTVWGWITAATPAVAFLVAVSMLERRASHRMEASDTAPAPEVSVDPAPAALEPAEIDPALSPALVAYARRLTADRPFNADQLAARIGVSPALASDLLTALGNGA